MAHIQLNRQVAATMELRRSVSSLCPYSVVSYPAVPSFVFHLQDMYVTESNVIIAYDERHTNTNLSVDEHMLCDM